jgi:hypothetical protein
MGYRKKSPFCEKSSGKAKRESCPFSREWLDRYAGVETGREQYSQLM